MTKVLALDLDGTLIDERNEIIGGGETLSLLEKLQAEGYEIVVVTGRLDHDIIHVAQKYNLNIKYRISQNGAVMQDDHDIKGRLISKEAALKIYRYIKDKNLRVELNTISSRYWHSDRDPDFPREFYDSSTILEDFTEVINYQPVVIFLLIGDMEEINKVRGYVLENFEEVDAVKTSDKTLEILPKGVSKGLSLKDMYPDAEIVSIGDSESDFSMFPYSKASYCVGKSSFGEANFDVPSIKEALENILKEDGNGK
ncbi:HAD-IIB family hydrolase [Clostridium polynesiense]|uniref:HAD-IIB family hydrolase n=1 Tax=Clostridium polynesiense TaxID=1325933 RepID=UPI00058B9B86|nr:HAD-IIB family hydrolase [Clostridium polynesiense]